MSAAKHSPNQSLFLFFVCFSCLGHSFQCGASACDLFSVFGFSFMSAMKPSRYKEPLLSILNFYIGRLWKTPASCC